jgi:hypothetical protein
MFFLRTAFPIPSPNQFRSCFPADIVTLHSPKCHIRDLLFRMIPWNGPMQRIPA